jgi:hypothetical protein
VVQSIGSLARLNRMSSSSSGVPVWVEKLLDRGVQLLQNETLRRKVQIQLLDPLVQYILERMFPYLILVGVVFGLMILMSASILVLLVVKGDVVSTAAAASAAAAVRAI